MYSRHLNIIKRVMKMLLLIHIGMGYPTTKDIGKRNGENFVHCIHLLFSNCLEL